MSAIEDLNNDIPSFTPSGYESAISTYLQGWYIDDTGHVKHKPYARVSSWGPPGVGKSEIHEDLAKKWRRSLRTIHFSQKNPHDLQGIPLKDGKKIKWEVTSYFPQQEIHRQNNTVVTYIPGFSEFGYAEYIIVRIEKDGEEVAVFGDGQRYDLGAGDLNTINARVDIIGVDEVTVDLTSSPVGNYKIFIEDACILFLDDLSAATKAVMKAGLQLINDYRVGEYNVPKSCPLACASNRECDGAYIETMNAAVANRLMHITVVPSLDDFFNYLIKKNAHPHYIAYFGYLKNEPLGLSTLFDYNKASMKDGNLGFATPRSWWRSHEQYESVLIHDNELKKNCPVGQYSSIYKKLLMKPMLTGFVGKKATSFLTFLDLYDEMVDPYDVLSGKISKLPEQYQYDAAYQSAFSVNLANALKKLKDKYVDEEIHQKFNDLKRQPVIWQNAVINYCVFCQTQFKLEINTMTAILLAQVYKVSPKYFLTAEKSGGNSKEVLAYTKELNEILTRIFMNKQKR